MHNVLVTHAVEPPFEGEFLEDWGEREFEKMDY
jgi:hypothetical protein